MPCTEPISQALSTFLPSLLWDFSEHGLINPSFPISVSGSASKGIQPATHIDSRWLSSESGGSSTEGDFPVDVLAGKTLLGHSKSLEFVLQMTKEQ